MCIRCLKEGMNTDSLSAGGVKQRPRWCPTGPDEAWWVETMYVDSYSVQSSSVEIESNMTTASSLSSSPPSLDPPCQLRYCYSQPVLLCTLCRYQAIATLPATRSLSSRNAPKSQILSSSEGHILQAEPPCWLLIPDWNMSFLHYTALLKAMHAEGCTVWSYDPRGQGLSESPSSQSCLSIDSFDRYATDLKCFLAFMRLSLPPSTQINVLAMGVLAQILYEKRHLWRETGCGVGGGGGECSGLEMINKVILMQAGADTPTLTLTWKLRLPDELGVFFSGWGFCNTHIRAGANNNSSSDNCDSSRCQKNLTLPLSHGLASLVLFAHKGILRGCHAFVGLFLARGRLTSSCLLKATQLGMKLVKGLLPSRIRDGWGLLPALHSLQHWLMKASLPFSKWLHDTPSLITLGEECSRGGQEEGGAGREGSLVRRYPFLRARCGSVMWYTHCFLLGGWNTSLRHRHSLLQYADVSSDGGDKEERNSNNYKSEKWMWVRNDVPIEELCALLVSTK